MFSVKGDGMDIGQAKSILAKQRAQRKAGILPTAQDDRDFWAAADVVAKRAPTPKRLTTFDVAALKRRTPAQVLLQLRRDFGDERRNAALWDTLPDPLQRHWALNKRAAGETLTAEERRAADTRPTRQYMTARGTR